MDVKISFPISKNPYFDMSHDFLRKNHDLTLVTSQKVKYVVTERSNLKMDVKIGFSTSKSYGIDMSHQKNGQKVPK
jgi:hypothetical protein